ncbi:hypothetical protein BJY01DRAFT_249958 [Aspergillus pseudoustus]|uniref:NAD(P)-binding protein n=1 Tax=Aspergillus pseudoustus TaxID=1810923 RepID=A0ABR4JLM7_9EURO
MPPSPPAWVSAAPAHYGMTWTEQYQSTADGPLEIRPNSLPTPFVVAVTGSGRGIGAEIARCYAKAGASGIMLTSRRASDLEHVAASIAEINSNTKVRYCVCDVTKQVQLAGLAAVVKQEFGRLDAAIINSATSPAWVVDQNGDGGSSTSPRSAFGILEDATEDFFRVLDGTFRSAYLSSRALLPLLRETLAGANAWAETGVMILTSSACSLFPTTDLVPFSASLSKLAVNRLVEVLHESYHQEGIRAHAIHPGGILTPGNSDFPDSCRAMFVDDISLPGGLCVWLTKGERGWLSGRYICANWDMDELAARREEIVAGDKFKMRLVL